MGGVRERGPLVSAVIPAYNAAAYVGEAIESVLQQTYAPIECIVVDDGSTDRTAEIAAEFRGNVRLLRQENRGVSAARNRGAREAAGELLAFLDADDRWLPERVERQLGALDDRPGIEAVVCANEVIDSDRRTRGIIHQDPGLGVEDLLLCRASLTGLGSSLLIRREAFEEIGGFDRALSTSADWAMNVRLVQRGRLATLAEPLVEVHMHGGNMSLSVEGFERDMLRAFDGVFADAAAEARVVRMRRRAYANLHRMIAGSYFVERRLLPFARHAARSIWLHPSTLPYFLAMPVRRLRRRLRQGEEPLSSPYTAGR
jgi:glycosyltransferase involved in cell wall biosynthesis